MPYITEAMKGDQIISMEEEKGTSPRPTTGVEFKLKRFGKKPLYFFGVEVAMAMSFTPNVPYWYELNLYRSDSGFAVAIKRFHQSPDVRDLFRAYECRSFDDVVELIEGYEPAEDLTGMTNGANGAMCAVECAQLAMVLKSSIGDIRSHFRELAGEFLCELCGS